MRGVQFLNLVAMPLAAAMPHLAWSTAPKHIEKRFTLIDDSQFHFEPAVLTNVGMECTRPTAADMYACQLRCKFSLPNHMGVGKHTDRKTPVDWYDPNSVKENDVNFCSCISKWSWDGNTTESGDKNTYNTEYSVCLWELPVSFKMRFYAFNSSQDFRLELAHHYQDSE